MSESNKMMNYELRYITLKLEMVSDDEL